jgi:hypothetical protein
MAQGLTDITSKGPHSPAKHSFDPAHSKLQFSLPQPEHPSCMEGTYRLLTKLKSTLGEASNLVAC